MKKVVSILLAALMAVSMLASFTACQTKTYEIAVVTDVGQLRDGGFNEGTYEGAKTYAEGHDLTFNYYQPANGSDATDEDRIAAMNQAIKNGAKIIVTPGFLQANAIMTVAAANPDVKFIFVDGWNLGLANVTAISYKEQESGYLAGYAVVKDGYTKLGGTFGGGGSNPACNRFAYGYVQGAMAAADELGVDVEIKISFQFGSGFSASPELKAQIGTWYTQGTEVVFSCGGSMISSVIAAASENTGKKIIGVDVDQSGLSEMVITSAVKGLADSVRLVLAGCYKGDDYWHDFLSDKTSNLGAADDATGLPMETSRFTTFTQADYEVVYKKIADGTLVPDSNVDGCDKADFWTKAVEGSHVTVIFE